MKTFACLLNEVPQNGMHCTTIDDEKYLIYREGDAFFAVTASCPHLGGPLEQGTIEEGCISCPWHKWRFDLKSGHCENVSNQQLRNYKVIVEKEKVYIELEE